MICSSLMTFEQNSQSDKLAQRHSQRVNWLSGQEAKLFREHLKGQLQWSLINLTPEGVAIASGGVGVKGAVLNCFADCRHTDLSGRSDVTP
jgi:hypothetical protein